MTIIEKTGIDATYEEARRGTIHMRVNMMMISVRPGTVADSIASNGPVGEIKKNTNAASIASLRVLRDSSTALTQMLRLNPIARSATAETSAQTRTKGSLVLKSGFPTPVANASEVDMARIKQYVSQLGDRYGLSQQEMEAVTHALASHPGQSLNAEIAMLDRILSTADSYPVPGARSQAARVLLDTYCSLTPARAARPERFPQALVESLTKWGFCPRPDEYRWTPGATDPMSVAYVLANTTDGAFNTLMSVMGPWEPNSYRAFGFLLQDRFRSSLLGFGLYSPEEDASVVVQDTTMRV